MDWETFIRAELERDGYRNDVTTLALLSERSEVVRATIFTRESGVFCGEEICTAFNRILSPALTVNSVVSDGAVLTPNSRVAQVSGQLPLCLSVERTLLNILAHLSGIASLTRQFVNIAAPYNVKILATRKTLPGLRELQLAAVRAGGGFVHRRSLSDGMLIKDNHLSFVEPREALQRARKMRSPLHRIEMEVQSLDELDRILEDLPDIVMLDNLGVSEIKAAVAKIDRRCEIEISGGLTLEKVEAIACLGVNYISVGSLTHSAKSLDLSMELEKLI